MRRETPFANANANRSSNLFTPPGPSGPAGPPKGPGVFHLPARGPWPALAAVLCLCAGTLCPRRAFAQGALTNGWTDPGALAAGHTDSWTFSANVGDAIVVRVGKSAGTFSPKLQLFSPSGTLLGTETYGGIAVELAVTATNAGIFTASVSDVAGTQTGTYRITLAKTGDPVVVAPSDDGGPMTNGWMHTGTIDVGDLDLWTFDAKAGDALIVRAGKTNSAAYFAPWLRLYGPNGALLGQDSYGGIAVEVAVTATNTGTYLVVLADGNANLGGTGPYRLTLAKTGEPVVVTPGDDGGPMTNGWMHTGTIDVGDLDLWTFDAKAGDALIVRGGKTNSAAYFAPWLRLYGPTGALVDQFNYGGLAAEVAVTATNTGTYLVVLADGNANLGGTGPYRLTLAKTRDAVFVSPGDEGGMMVNGFPHVGATPTGDLDVWTFTACDGDGVTLRLDSLSGTFAPWLRLFDPHGVLLGSVDHATSAQITLTAPSLGTYLVLVADGNANLGGHGTYQLTGTGIASGLALCKPIVSGTNLIIRAVGGPTNGTSVVFASTNVAAPVRLWTPISTNQFDLDGVFRLTNAYNPSVPKEFFLLQEQ